MTWPWNHKTKSLHGGSVLSNSTQLGLSCIVIWKRGNFFFIHTKNSYSLHLFCYVNNQMEKKKNFIGCTWYVRTLLLSKLQAASHCVWLQRWRILNSNSVGNLNCSSFFLQSLQQLNWQPPLHWKTGLFWQLVLSWIQRTVQTFGIKPKWWGRFMKCGLSAHMVIFNTNICGTV